MKNLRNNSSNDKYFQIITIEKSTKLNKLHSENVRNRFVYERVNFKFKHGGDPRSCKKLESSQQGARNNPADIRPS